MKQNTYLLIEFFILFILLPISFVFQYSIYLKVCLAVLGFGYIVFILRKIQGISFKIDGANNHWSSFLKRVGVQFFVIAVVTLLYVWFKDRSSLFYVPRTNFLLFIAIVFVYTILSVWPQEVIYRTFFFAKYEQLFKNKKILIFINAVIFSLAHIFFKNVMVLILTFVGGLLFAFTFYKTRATFLVTIEHALYGNWLFAVGMGESLAFPGMDTA